MSTNDTPTVPNTTRAREGGYIYKQDLLQYLKQRWPNIADQSFDIKHVREDRMTFKAPESLTDDDYRIIRDIEKQRRAAETAAAT